MLALALVPAYVLNTNCIEAFVFALIRLLWRSHTPFLVALERPPGPSKVTDDRHQTESLTPTSQNLLQKREGMDGERGRKTERRKEMGKERGWKWTQSPE